MSAKADFIRGVEAGAPLKGELKKFLKEKYGSKDGAETVAKIHDFIEAVIKSVVKFATLYYIFVAVMLPRIGIEKTGLIALIGLTVLIWGRK